MHLCHLIREHVTVVVVACHAKTTLSPPSNLHAGRVTDRVQQIPFAVIQTSLDHKLRAIVLIEDHLAALPKPVLPLEYGLIGDNVGCAIILEAALGKTCSPYHTATRRPAGCYSVYESGGAGDCGFECLLDAVHIIAPRGTVSI